MYFLTVSSAIDDGSKARGDLNLVAIGFLFSRFGLVQKVREIGVKFFAEKSLFVVV